MNNELDSLIKSRFESTGKILGLAFVLVAIVFTRFGIKTIIDVREVARSTAIEEIKSKLSIYDPNSDFRRDIDKIAARGIVDSYLISMSKSKSNPFQSDIAISETDLRRIQNLIGDSRITLKDFSDAFEVLLESNSWRRNENLENLSNQLALE